MENKLLKYVSLRSTWSQPIQRLPGWKKSYRLPDRYSSESDSFVTKCGDDLIRAEMDLYFSKLKEAFSFTRKELAATDPEDGIGAITTPHFAYSLSLRLNPDQLDEVLWTRSVDSIQNYQEVNTPAFQSVFDNVFDRIQLAFPKPIQLEDFIDAIELAKVPGLKLDYDRNITYCELILKGVPSKVMLTASTLSIEHLKPTKTSLLFKSMDSIQRLINDHHFGKDGKDGLALSPKG